MTANPETTPAIPATSDSAARTYEVRTYGCQMNVHDSERLSGLAALQIQFRFNL